MKILLDECIPRKLKREFPDHEVQTVPQMGWSGKKNGALLRLMDAAFDLFVTMDQNLEYQQNLSTARVAIMVLHAPSNRLQDILPLMPSAKQRLSEIVPGIIINVEVEDDKTE